MSIEKLNKLVFLITLAIGVIIAITKSFGVLNYKFLGAYVIVLVMELIVTLTVWRKGNAAKLV